jgi:hypothetical protein
MIMGKSINFSLEGFEIVVEWASHVPFKALERASVAQYSIALFGGSSGA